MKYSAKKLVIMALLAAAATVIFVIEAQIPLPIPVPGVKLGFANIITLFALFYTGRRSSGKKKSKKDKEEAMFTAADVFMILLCRIALSALLSGRIVALIYSAAGGILAFAVLLLMRQIVSRNRMWACGSVSAVFHNIGQIAAAVVITGAPSVAAYLPVLIIAGIITGAVTGLIAQAAVGYINIGEK